jgi:hypothetical protein
MGQWVKHILGLGVGTLFLLALGGCPCGNGYPYGADSCGYSARQTPDYSGGSSPNSSGIAPSIYRWYDPSYVCVPDGSSTPVASERARLVSLAGSWTLLGDHCSVLRGDPETVISADDIERSSSPDVLGYRDGIFEKARDGQFTSAWCLDDLGSGIEARIDRSVTASRLIVSDGVSSSRLIATRALVGSFVRYETGFHRLDIELSRTAAGSYFHEGRLTFQGGAALGLRCRLTEP